MLTKIFKLSKFSLLHKMPMFTFAAQRKGMVRDADQLSILEMEEVLGYPIDKINKAKDKMMHSNEHEKGLEESEGNILTEKQKPYFYELMPLHNYNYPQCIDPDVPVILETPNQNIFNELCLPIDCSFDDYTQALSKYRTQTDLYGDEEEKSIIENTSLEFKNILTPDSKYLMKARHNVLVNLSIPGTIEASDPRNYMDLRPIEEFRHTPLVPIQESKMRQYKQMLQRYHRSKFVFEVKGQTVMNWTLIVISLAVASYLIHLIMEKEEERTVNYSRLKYQRIMGQSPQVPVFKI